MSSFPNPLQPIGRISSRIRELSIFAITAGLLLTTAIPFGAGWLNLGRIAAWVACLIGYALLVRLANQPSSELHVVFTRYLMVVILSIFAAVRINRALLFGARASGVTWASALCTVGIVLAAAAVLPRLRSFRESAELARLEHDRFLAAAESTLDDFYIFDGVYNHLGQIVDFRFNYINPNAERRLHVRRENLIGKVLTEVRPYMITSGLIHKYREVVRTGVPFITEVFIDDDMIQATWLNVQVVKLGDGIAITSRDVTENRRTQERIQHLAHYDALTGLANRTLLYDRLRQAILMAQRHHTKVAVFMLDLDNFKRINDTLGHEQGDTLLATLGQRLLASVRESDTVARLGGDEFVIVLPEFQTIHQVRRCGQTLLRNAARPIEINGETLQVTLSMGVAIFPDTGQDIPSLLRQADLAMYGIKDSGRNGMRIYTPVTQGELPLQPFPEPAAMDESLPN